MNYLSRIKNKKGSLGTLVSTTLLASVMGVATIQKVQADAVFNYWDVMAKDSVKYMGAPELLSQTGLYTGDVAKPKITNPVIFHFDVNSALWSDGAHKNRWVYVPNGKKIGFDRLGDYYSYPDSTVFIKQFDIDTIPGDTTSRVFWETRLLINMQTSDTVGTTVTKHDRWYGYSYKWNKDQKDAQLVNKNKGLNDTIRFYPNGINQPSTFKKWAFPSRYTCTYCHANRSDTIQGRTILGFFTAQLNRPHPDSTAINQLEYFFKKGLLSGTKPSNWNDTPFVPKWAGIGDSMATLDLRARSYIAANCSGCHGQRGIQLEIARKPNLNYDFHTNRPAMEMRNEYVSISPAVPDSTMPVFFPITDTIMNPRKLDTLRIPNRLVQAGYPYNSMILYRQRARQTQPGNWNSIHDQMPPVATFEVNVPATDLIEKWIKAMPRLRDQSILAIRHISARTMLKSPTIEGRLLHLPAELVGSGSQKIYITNIAGRNFELSKVNAATYSVPLYLASGLYVIHVGNQTFKGYLF